MVMWPSDRLIDEVVAAEEKLGDIAAKVVHQIEFTARVHPLVSIQIQH